MFVMKHSPPAATPPRPRIKLGLRTWRDDLATVDANQAVAAALAEAGRALQAAGATRRSHHARVTETRTTRALAAGVCRGS